ncbi:HEAT repeat domain-containing protein [Alkaliphilus oremlandii]|uniref:PBS lyase HEAT domain protein repeat-containing protein n=1 Tax=Alkaliphilus oremlandii (strain OhILAs) TaxID=350688 RepID=A8MHP3_ALKOO|nr:HEAT repeat domain-containing protein [Alkaliphilus oremlandii]ABW19325.1 PBS lyase HEAT domain protein repeat-containing protein [Alkaliphilus oremlandii OhILAs]
MKEEKDTFINSTQHKIDDHFFISLLAGTKDERIEILNSLDETERIELATFLLKKIPMIENAEDKMIALWIAGEIKKESLTPVIHNEISHKHGGVRRMVCSALGKIGSVQSVDILHRGLQDVKPQVRQYAAKALKEIGNEKTIRRLNGLLNNPKELPYVRRSYEEAIHAIESRRKDPIERN